MSSSAALSDRAKGHHTAGDRAGWGNWNDPERLLLWLLSDPERRAAAPVTGLDAAGWAEFADLAIGRHRVFPAVAAALGDLPAGAGLPAAERKKIEAAARENALDALRRKAETRQIFAALEARGIGAVLLKGWAVAEQVHGSAALRHAKDIDILVAPGDAAPAAAVLRAAGWYGALPDRLDGSAKDASFFRSDVPGSEVELHWRPLARRNLPGLAPGAAALAHWPDCGTGWRVAVPGVEVNLVYLAVHAGESAAMRLKWLHDIARMLAQRSPAEIAAAVALARRSGHARPFALAIRLAHDLLAAPLPPDMPTPGARDRMLLRRAVDALRRPASAVESGRARARHILFKLALCDGPADALGFIGDELAQRLGSTSPRARLRDLVIGGFPWPMPGTGGMAPLRAAARRTRLRRWPWAIRPVAVLLMVPGWIAGSLAGAIRHGKAAGPMAILRLWARALRQNAAPGDMVGEGEVRERFLAMDEHAIRAALTAPAVTALLDDPDAFATLCDRTGVPHAPGAQGPVVRILTGRGRVGSTEGPAEALLSIPPLPDGHPALAAACQAHDAMPPGVPVLLWEIGLGTDAPSVIRASAEWNIAALERQEGRPLCTGRFRAILLEHLR